MPRITVTVTEEVLRWLKDREKQGGRTVAAAARWILEQAKVAS